MRFDISHSTYPDGSTKFIARDTSGVVRLREDSLEKLQQAIVAYNETLASQAVAAEKAKTKVKGLKGKKKDEVEEVAPVAELPPALQPTEGAHKDMSALEPVEETPESDLSTETSAKEEETPPAATEEEEPLGDLLKNDLKEKIEEKKKTTSKKSFWDKLK